MTTQNIARSLIFSFTFSAFAFAGPHPYLLQTAKEGRWADFKSFLLMHPQETENFDDSVFRLIESADRWDVLDGRPLPSAPFLEEDEPKSNDSPKASAPPLEEDNEQVLADSLLAKELQNEEFQAEPDYTYVEDQRQSRSKVCSFAFCRATDFALGAAVAIGAYLVWTLNTISN